MAENTNRMGVVGERDAVLAFKAVGMRVIPVQTPAETTAALHKLSTEGVPEALEKYKTMPGTAVIPIPGSRGSNGLGMSRVRANVEKAIGADILFNNEKEGV